MLSNEPSMSERVLPTSKNGCVYRPKNLKLPIHFDVVDTSFIAKNAKGSAINSIFPKHRQMETLVRFVHQVPSGKNTCKTKI